MNASIIILLVFLLIPFFGRGQVQIADEKKQLRIITSDPLKASAILDDSLYHNAKASQLERRARHELDSGLAFLNKAIDSVNNIANSPQEYQRTIGRLYARFDSTFLSPLKLKGDSLGDRVKQRMYRIEKSLDKKKGFVDSVMTANPLSSKTNLSAAGLNLPQIPLSSEKMSLDGVKDLNESLPNLSLSDKLEIPDVDWISNPINKVGDVTEEVKVYKDKINGFPDASVNNDKIIERFEKELLEVKEIDALQNGSQAMEKVKQQVEGITGNLKDQEKLKEEIKTKTKKQFVDHFAGHQDKIESEIKSMEKLQRKYHSVADVRYLPKRRTNPEKGKPFVERLIIGTSVQIDRKDPKWTGMDVSPYGGYKFSDRFRMGVGGTYRVTFDAKTFEFMEQNRVYGFRTFGNYRIFNGWFGHLEFETLKMKIPPAYASLLASKNYEGTRWTPMAYVGLFKTFGISKHFQGQTQVLYDFLKVEENFHFNKVAFRCGFEYKIITKKK